MIRALLREVKAPGTGKTQTRRKLKPQPTLVNEAGSHSSFLWKKLLVALRMYPKETNLLAALPIKAGARIWVRETWRTLQKWDDLKPSHVMDDVDKIDFAATGYLRNPLWAWGKSRPAIFMPRWASRLTLAITDVRIERLQAISEADALAEGITCETVIVNVHCYGGTHCEETAVRYFFDGPNCPEDGFESGIDAYAALWDSINGDGAWDENPWVVAYTFTVAPKNIDAA